jgi:tetratricopeptide (TPR) repeat protein
VLKATSFLISVGCILQPINMLAQNDAADYARRAQTELVRDNYDGAIADCDKAIQLDPNNANAYKIRGEAKERKGDYDGAIADCDKAIQLDPQSASAYDARAWVKVAKKDPDGAIADWDKAVELDPKNELFYESRGLCKRCEGRYDEAIADFSRAIQLVPRNSRWYLDRGWTKLQKGQYDEAITDYDQAIDIQLKQNEGVVGYRERGIAKQLKGDFDGATADFIKEVQFQPSVTSQIDLWLIRVRQGQTAAADQELSRYLAQDHYPKPDDWSLKIASFLTDKITEADFLAAVSSSGAASDVKNSEIWYYAGMKHLVAGDKKKASEYFAKCVTTKMVEVEEYYLAMAELKTLGSN